MFFPPCFGTQFLKKSFLDDFFCNIIPIKKAGFGINVLITAGLKSEKGAI